MKKALLTIAISLAIFTASTSRVSADDISMYVENINSVGGSTEADKNQTQTMTSYISYPNIYEDQSQIQLQDAQQKPVHPQYCQECPEQAQYQPQSPNQNLYSTQNHGSIQSSYSVQNHGSIQSSYSTQNHGSTQTHYQ